VVSIMSVIFMMTMSIGPKAPEKVAVVLHAGRVVLHAGRDVG
jgi:hypothetical protein